MFFFYVKKSKQGGGGMDKSCSNANTRYCTGERSERETVGKSGKKSVCVCVCVGMTILRG